MDAEDVIIRYSQEECIEAIKKDPSVIEYLTTSQKTLDVCLILVQTSDYRIERMIDHYPYPEILLAAVQRNGYMISRINQDQLTDELIVEAAANIPEDDWPIYVPGIYGIRKWMSTKKAI